MDRSILEQESQKARAVFEKNCKHPSQFHFGNFPVGACGKASCFLAAWLASKGVRNIKYVYGQRKKIIHGWLEIEGLIVDITSDQFSDGLGRVYIGSDRRYHDQFIEQREGSCGIPKILAGEFKQFMKLMQIA